MLDLSTLTPAETLFALKLKSADLRELLKLTFMDLLLKKVFKIQEIEKRISKREVRNYKYVLRGENFHSYREREHEFVYLDFYRSDKMAEALLFQHVVKMGFEKSKNEDYYQRLVSFRLRNEKYISKNFLQNIFGGYSLTDDGKKLQQNLQSQIDQLNSTLPDLISTDRKKALEILLQIKGNVFLLSSIDFELMRLLDRELMDQFKDYKPTTTTGSCSGCTTWPTFDSGCSGSGCGSGCGGDGCSGCGGCGGCGGD